MNGFLVINHYMKSEKFEELYSMIKESAYRYNINLSVITNREINVDTATLCFKDNKVDFVLFWDKDIELARYIELQGVKVFNGSEAIRICDDKALTHIELSCTDIKMPRTLVQPFTYKTKYCSTDVEEMMIDIMSKLKYPIVVKARKGSFGEQVYLVDNDVELKNVIMRYPSNALIFQEYIEASKGRDIRLQVVGDEVVCGMYRYSETDFRANITNGGRMKKYIPNSKECELAVKACKTIGLDFGGVDILFGDNDTPILCEINSNAHFVNLYKATNVNVADKIFEYIKNIIRDNRC